MATTNLFGALALDATLQAVRDYIASIIGTRGAGAAADAKGIPSLGTRHDADTATVDDGELCLLHTDEIGRLKVATQPGSFPAVVGTANTVADVVVADVTRASNITFHVKNVGSATLAAGTFIFEASIDSTNGTDGTGVGIQAGRTNANTPETSIALTGITAGAGYATAWEASVNAYNWFRLRCTVAVTASASAQWTIVRGSYATEPVPIVQSHGVTGTVTVAGTVTATATTGTPYNLTGGASTNSVVVRNAAASLFTLAASNPTAATVYVKLYNMTTAPVVGTSVPTLTMAIPAGGCVVQDFGRVGQRYGTGIGIATTAGAPATDTAAVAAGVQIHATYV